MPQEFANVRAQPQQAQEAQESHRNAGQTRGSKGRSETAQSGADALDAVLDDIESTLESNAEEYVSSFVQKGGE